MDIQTINNDKFLVALSPTESKMLNEMAFKISKEPSELLKRFIFCSIATEHSTMELEATIAEQTDWNNH